MESATLAKTENRDCPLLILYDGSSPRPVSMCGDRLSLGRDGANDVVVYDASVALRHGLLQRTERGFEVFNLAGAGALKWNGRSVEAHEIRCGDVLDFGTVRAVFLDPLADVLPAGMQLWFSHPELAAQAGLSLPVPDVADTTSTDTFHDEFLAALRRAPWMLVSTFLHVLVYLAVIYWSRAPASTPQLRPEILNELAAAESFETMDELLDERALEDISAEIPAEPVETPEDFAIPEDLSETPGEADLDADDAAPSMQSMFGSGSSGFNRDDNLGSGATQGADLGKLGSATREHVYGLRASGLDVVFLVDATGSMEAEIESAKRHTADLIMLMESLGLGFRLGVVAFRDAGDEYVVRTLPLTPYTFKAVNFLDEISANGGGDTPEAVYEALQEASRLKWAEKARKLIILVGDAPPHPRRQKECEDLCTRLARRNGQVHTLLAERSLSRPDLGSAKGAFERLADAGGGRARSLSGDAQFTEDILMLALSTDDRREIRALLRSATSSWKTNFLKARFDAGDLEFLRDELASRTMQPVSPREFFRNNRPELIPVYLTVLNDSSAPLRNHWLATVLLRRILREVDGFRPIGALARRSLAEFSPEEPAAVRTRLLQNLAKGLLEQGILE